MSHRRAASKSIDTKIYRPAPTFERSKSDYQFTLDRAGKPPWHSSRGDEFSMSSKPRKFARSHRCHITVRAHPSSRALSKQRFSNRHTITHSMGTTREKSDVRRRYVDLNITPSSCFNFTPRTNGVQLEFASITRHSAKFEKFRTREKGWA